MEKCIGDGLALKHGVRRSAIKSALTSALGIPSLIWGFTESDFPTFVIPNSTFGILGALAANRLTDGETLSLVEVTQRLPLVLLFNWLNLLIFDIANQRSDESVTEDLINKPWRPIPAGKVTGDQARRAMLAIIPITLAVNYYTGAWKEGAFIQILTWLYNDLKGGDGLARDLIISVAYGLFNHGSLQIALDGRAEVNQHGLTWVLIISGVIFTTMQVQDLKDQEGDRTRGRLTVPLFLGENVSRALIAFFVLFWSGICVFFWGLDPWIYAIPLGFGGLVAASVLFRTTQKQDAQTWKFWCFWLIILYSLPLMAVVAGW